MPVTERGASAVLIAATMLLLLGAVAIGIDAGAGFNERRQSQTSADMGVLAGVLEFFDRGACGGPEDGACDSVLKYVRDNLTTQFSDSDWLAIWQGCTDPTKPTGFAPLRVEGTWAGLTGTTYDGRVVSGVDCISASTKELRVRVPDQLVETAFGGAVGVDQLRTWAMAQARLVSLGGRGAVIPFGVLNGAEGYDCLLQPPNGISEEPCVGGSTGSYGAIYSQTWGSDRTIIDCASNQWGPEVRINTAWGLDHFLEPISDTSPLPPDVDEFKQRVGQPGNWPAIDEATVLDRCAVVDGVAIPEDSLTGSGSDLGVPNTVEADTGADAGDDAFHGLIIGAAGSFPNAIVPADVEPRLVFRDTNCVDGSIDGVRVRCLDLGGYGTYLVDDMPLHEWLVDPSIDPTAYEHPDDPSLTCVGPLSDPVNLDCVLRSPDLASPIFSADILKSRRFVWTPEFFYDEWGSGAHWQPIIGFRPTYIHGLWINTPNNRVYYEPGSDPGVIDVTNPNALDAVSSFILPSASLPASVNSSCPVCVNAEFEPELSR